MKGEVLTRREVAALINACSHRYPTGARNGALIALLYRSGLRIAEALALRYVDLDQVGAEVRVRRGKGGKGRAVPVDPECVAVVQRWLSHREGLPVHQRYGPLFCTLEGGPVATRYVRQMLPRLGERAELGRRVHAHALRHTYATELARERVSIVTISRLLGHKSVETTARYLAELCSPAELRDVIAARPKWKD